MNQRILSGLFALIVLLTPAVKLSARESPAESAINLQQAVLTPGRTEDEMNVCWYSRQPHSPSVRLSLQEDMADAVIHTGWCSRAADADDVSYISNKVTVTGLQPASVYYYQVRLDGDWQPVASFRTADPDGFSFLFVGDPQIGASLSLLPTDDGMSPAQRAALAVHIDSRSWAAMLDAALADHPQIRFVLSAGDQINTPARENTPAQISQQEHEYAGFLAPAALRRLPVAAVLGNHDRYTAGYRNHFHHPNIASADDSGHYFAYGNALFVLLNTNNHDPAAHRSLMEAAVAAHPDATWRIAAIHHDIYGVGEEHAESDGMLLRTQLTPLFDEFAVDAVLQGHDHSYCRTHHLTGDGQTHGVYDHTAVYDDAFRADNLCYRIAAPAADGVALNPDGTLYLAAGSATGSKLHGLTAAVPDYVALRSQTWTPTYTVIELTDSTFSLKTYDMADQGLIDDYFIVKR